MTIEWIWTSVAMLCAVGAVLYVTQVMDERKWAREAELDRLAQAEWERTHPAE